MGCSEKHEEMPQPEPGSPLELLVMTRTDGATQIGDASCPDIKAWLTTAEGPVQEGSFHYTNTGWESTLSVKEERQYYLYGYMPGSTINATDPTAADGDFSNGVDFTMNSLPAISNEDICVIIGVQRIDGTGTSVANVQEGNYGYLSGIVGKNYVNLLMGRLYSGLELNFMIDEDYAKLRSIHLTEVKLNCTYGTVNATLNIRNGSGVGTPAFVQAVAGAHSATFLSTETVLDKRYVNSPLVIDKLVYCAPSVFDADGTYLSITSKYHVYDNKGSDLGERTATNKLKITAGSLVPGQKKTVVLTVKPTYLYILSDGDLDNPVVTIN